MARRSSTAQAPVEEVVETPAEELDTETVEEAVEETTEAPAQAPAKEEAPEADLTPFKEAAAAALEEADHSTGDLPKIAIDSVNKVYREIDGVKGKNQARTWLDEEMKASIVAKDVVKAKAFVMLKDGLSAASGSSTPKAPADPTQAFVQRVVALRLAQEEVVSNVPEGVNEAWPEKADTLIESLIFDMTKYREYLAATDDDAEQPEVSPVVRQAFKLAQGKSTGGAGRASGGPRRGIEKHLQQVFADLPVGSFLTVNEIAKAASTEYGDDRPSAGAVSARLFPKGRPAYDSDTIKASAEEGKPRGAVKVA